MGAIRGGGGKEETVVLRSPLHVDISHIQNLPAMKSDNKVPASYLSTPPCFSPGEIWGIIVIEVGK